MVQAAKSALFVGFLREVAVRSTSHEPAESATTNLLPKIAVPTSRSTERPCCT